MAAAPTISVDDIKEIMIEARKPSVSIMQKNRRQMRRLRKSGRERVGTIPAYLRMYMRSRVKRVAFA